MEYWQSYLEEAKKMTHRSLILCVIFYFEIHPCLIELVPDTPYWTAEYGLLREISGIMEIAPNLKHVLT
jgi:hypothetical protein